MRRLLDLTEEEFAELKQSWIQVMRNSHDLEGSWTLGVALHQIIARHNLYTTSASHFFELINNLKLADLKIGEEVVFVKDLPLNRTL